MSLNEPLEKGMYRLMIFILLYTVIVLLCSHVPITVAHAQSLPPAEQMRTMEYDSPIAPTFKSARNMAIQGRIGVNTFNNLFECFEYDSRYFMIVKENEAGVYPSADTSAFRFYDVTDPAQPIRLGRINLPVTFTAGDIESFKYGDSTRLIFYAGRRDLDHPGTDLYLDILVTPYLMENQILDEKIIDSSQFSIAQIRRHYLYAPGKYNEMMYGYNHRLLLATNLAHLRMIDVSTDTSFSLLPDIQLEALPS